MAIRLTNTLAGKVETFEPLTPGQVGMYVCGVTVYDLCHIGHARAAVVFDVIRRWLEYRDYRVLFVKNFTDVDDKIIRRANEEGVSSEVIAERYIAAHQEDMRAIGVRAGDLEPQATAHIPQMIALIRSLIQRGIAYHANGDVYFAVKQFPPYGRLSGRPIDELLAGARVEVDERKRDPLDFALWKASKPGEPSWESPWGPGRPGWHIECSAMSMEYLGPTFDIHGGGEDLIFPHHENEIAQSEVATGKPFARYWIHNGFVRIGDEKMSKSLGNVLTVREMVKRHDPEALRLWLISAHYRRPLDYAEERLVEAGRALERFRNLFADVDRRGGQSGEVTEGFRAERAEHRRRFEAAMDEDFNTPLAIGVLFEMVRAANGYRQEMGAKAGPVLREAVTEIRRLGGTLGLFEGLGRERVEASGLIREIETLIQRRDEARARRDWAQADKIRGELDRMGVVLEDTREGTTWKWKP